MNILTVIQRYYPVIGGAEILTKDFLDHLSKLHQVTVYTTNAADIDSFWNKDAKKISKSEPMDYEVIRTDFLTPEEIKFDEKISKLPFALNHPGPFSPKMWTDFVVDTINYDLIFAISFPYDHILPAYVASKKWKIPLVIMPLIHQEFPNLFLSTHKITMLNNSDAVFVISNHEKKLLIENGINENKISVIQPFLKKTHEKLINSDEFRKKLKINSDDKIVLYVGSKSFVKGVIHLIDAMRNIWKTRQDLSLVLIGPSSKQFEDFFKKLPKNVTEKIIDLGIVNEQEKHSALESCEMLALPSKSESFGMVYVEAWNHGKPVIGCNMAPISEIIEHEKNGLLVEFGNINDISKAILYLIDNPSISKKFGEEGMKKSTLYYSVENLQNFEKKCISIVDSFKNKTHQ